MTYDCSWITVKKKKEASVSINKYKRAAFPLYYTVWSLLLCVKSFYLRIHSNARSIVDNHLGFIVLYFHHFLLSVFNQL